MPKKLTVDSPQRLPLQWPEPADQVITAISVEQREALFAIRERWSLIAFRVGKAGVLPSENSLPVGAEMPWLAWLSTQAFVLGRRQHSVSLQIAHDAKIRLRTIRPALHETEQKLIPLVEESIEILEGVEREVAAAYQRFRQLGRMPASPQIDAEMASLSRLGSLHKLDATSRYREILARYDELTQSDLAVINA